MITLGRRLIGAFYGSPTVFVGTTWLRDCLQLGDSGHGPELNCVPPFQLFFMAVAPSRSWVFTWNNYPADAYDQLMARREGFHACFVGKEVGASGTPHLQGVLISKKPCRLASLTRMFPGVHFEVMRGSERQAVDYTKKEGNPDRLEWDDRHQGSRTDLAAVCELVRANPRIAPRVVASQMPAAFVKFHAGVTALSRALVPVPPLTGSRDVFWYWGATGTGKTHTAIEQALAAAGGDDSNVFVWSLKTLKFAGSYSGEEYVVFEELRPSWSDFSFARLLSLLDKYRCEVEVKGGQVWWNAKAVWVTSPLEPFQMLSADERAVNPHGIEQLVRRIKGVRSFTERYRPPSPPAICPDSCAEDEGQPSGGVASPPPPVHVATPPLPRSAFDPIVTDTDTDTEGMLANMVQRRGAMCLRPLEDPIESTSDSGDDPVMIAVERDYFQRA